MEAGQKTVSKLTERWWNWNYLATNLVIPDSIWKDPNKQEIYSKIKDDF